MNLSRIVVVFGGVLFATIGMAIWVAPQQAAQSFDLEAIGVPGLVAIRADLGGLFLGLGSLCLAGAISGRRTFLFATALMLGAIAIGRVVGIVLGSGAGRQGGSLAIEIGAIAILLFCTGRFPADTLPPGSDEVPINRATEKLFKN